MKIAGVFLLVLMTGCSTVDNLKRYWPRPHDPGLVTAYVELEKNMALVNCSDKLTVNAAIDKADTLNKYAFFRQDPMMDATNTVMINLNKAAASSENACKRFVNLANINLKTIKESWSSR